MMRPARVTGGFPWAWTDPPMPPTRTVHCADALQFLGSTPLPERSSVLTSLPDSSELRRLPFAAWRDWFVAAAGLVVRSTPRDGAAIFYQTDTRHDGTWVDKAFLVQQGAAASGAALVWHKLVLRAPAGRATFGRPGYAHLLCFAAERREPIAASTPDVLPELGTMTWPKAIGLPAARFAVGWLRDHAGATTIVDPFCGVGTALAVANELGLDALGVEKNPGRAAKARALVLPPHS